MQSIDVNNNYCEMPWNFALILALSLSVTTEGIVNVCLPIIKHDALFLNSIFVHHITVNLRYLSGFAAVMVCRKHSLCSDLTCFWSLKLYIWLTFINLDKFFFFCRTGWDSCQVLMSWITSREYCSAGWEGKGQLPWKHWQRERLHTTALRF